MQPVRPASRTRVYALRKANADFAAAWDDALDEAVDMLELKACRRAIEGVAHPVFYRGRVVGEIRRHSDTLLMFLLRALRPQRYREPPVGAAREAPA